MIYDKTEKGREEIATRKHQLPARLRTLLVMIDGRNPLESVLRNTAGLGLDDSSVALLLHQDYIRLISGAPEAANEPEHAAPAAPRRREVDPAAVAQVAAVAAAGLAEAQQFRDVQAFYAETIRSTLGLRGFLLQKKVDQSATLDELRALRTAYLEAVDKAKGRELARSLRARLDALLDGVAPAGAD